MKIKKKKEETEEEIFSRVSKSFSSSSIGIRLISFQKFMQTKLLRGQEFKKLEDIAMIYDTRFSFPEENTIGIIKQEISNIFNKVVDYQSYLSYIEYGGTLNDKQMNTLLVTSLLLAKKKKVISQKHKLLLFLNMKIS